MVIQIQILVDALEACYNDFIVEMVDPRYKFIWIYIVYNIVIVAFYILFFKLLKEIY